MEKAREWYTRAAEQGNVPAQANLGVMYLKGDGIPVDIPQAIALLSEVLAVNYLAMIELVLISVRVPGWQKW